MGMELSLFDQCDARQPICAFIKMMGLIACIVYHMCVRVFVHVGHAKVIVSARSPLYMMCGYVTRRGTKISI